MASRSLSTNYGPSPSVPSSPGATSRRASRSTGCGAPLTRARGRYAAGSKVPRHRHEGTEHIYVLIGTQRDERGEYETGAHVVNLPGSVHSVSSPEGCVVFVVWERPNTFIDEPG